QMDALHLLHLVQRSLPLLRRVRRGGVLRVARGALGEVHAARVGHGAARLRAAAGGSAEQEERCREAPHRLNPRTDRISIFWSCPGPRPKPAPIWSHSFELARLIDGPR